MAKEWNGVQSVLKELIMAEDEAFIAGAFLVKYYTYIWKDFQFTSVEVLEYSLATNWISNDFR